MSLFGSIQLGANTLRAMQIGLQVVGNNIANANTPGYVRQETLYVPGPVQRVGRLVLGLGVTVEGVVQKIDRFVQERLVAARGDRASAEVQERAYRDIEVMLNELSDDVDLSSSLVGFFNSMDEVLKDPGNVGTRSLAVGKGLALASDMRNLNSRLVSVQQDLNSRVVGVADQINDLAETIRTLNVQVTSLEGSGNSASDAGGVRVLRQEAIDKLSELVGIRVVEQTSGSVNVAIGGEFLVFEGQRRAVEVEHSAGQNGTLATVRFADTHANLTVTAGELQGLYAARDEIMGGFLEGLDNLAGTLTFEFNKLYSQGQGLNGFASLTSTNAVTDTEAALDAAGLPFTAVNGAFDLLVYNKQAGVTKTYSIRVDLNGLDEDVSLENLAAQLDALDGLVASVTSSGRLQIAADSSDTEFAFAGDTSGVLAALGINTFFTGSNSRDIGVNDELKGITNAGKLAVSLGGIGEDAGNAERLAAFFDTPLEDSGGASLADMYDQLINGVTNGSAITQSVAEGFRVFEGTLEGQQQEVSGVSIDEEAIRMISLQRIYQASARYIQTVSELLELLVNL